MVRNRQRRRERMTPRQKEPWAYTRRPNPGARRRPRVRLVIPVSARTRGVGPVVLGFKPTKRSRARWIRGSK